jgi:hypothetical protein
LWLITGRFQLEVKNIDVWKEKAKRLKRVLKGWNINEEGKIGEK